MTTGAVHAWDQGRAQVDILGSPLEVSAPAPDGNRRFLFVSYVFPPTGGAGVQRPVKFIKYLGRAGWQPYVLTAQNPSVPTTDQTLSADIASEVHVSRTRTLEPGYGAKRAITSSSARRLSLAGIARKLVSTVLLPDPQILWLPSAVQEGVRLVTEHGLKAVVVSGPPFSSFVVAAIISRRTNVPLIVDYRDEWTLSSKYWENRSQGRISGALQRKLEEWVLRSAAVVVATTRMSADALAAACKEAASPARVTHIYNGYDPEDFAPVQRHAAGPHGRRPFVLSYVGTLWNLTSIEPLVRAVEEFLRVAPARREDLEVIIAGRVTPTQRQWVDRLAATGIRVQVQEYLPHDRAVALMRNSSGLCVLLSGVPGAERVVPAKIFEYMATERPILGIMPEGEASRILAQYPLAECVDTNDAAGIVGWLQRMLSDTVEPMVDVSAALHPYRRDTQARALAELLGSVIGVAEPQAVIG